MSTPLLRTKLYIPPVRPELVARPRLLEELDAAFGPDLAFARRLTIVSAPAGFGKTTLLAEWAANCGPRARFAWLSVDPRDNDPARFVAYLKAALGTGQEAMPGQDERQDFAPSGPFAVEVELTDLINMVSTLSHPVVLCLDDYHLVEAQAVHDALAFLVDHLPDSMHIAIATRSDPPLPLARLRARGQLTELRQADLRFTVNEATAFLTGVTGLKLSPKDVAALEARTEGWIAGLQMAALAMRGSAVRDWQGTDGARGLSEFIQAFTGSNRYILDYLMAEVLDQQSLMTQQFLLKTSVLERLCGPLCDGLLGGAGSQQMLEGLERANLFIVPLDDERRWYRYHRLFSDLLRRRLRQAHPELMPTLHRRASEWYEGQGQPAAAIDHALAAASLDHDEAEKNLERAANLVECTVEMVFKRGEVVTFLSWMERLPVDLVRAHPNLCFFHAWALAMSGRSLDLVEERLHDIACLRESTGTDEVLPGRLAALRAYMLLFQGDMHGAAELCHQALDRLPQSDEFLRSIVTWILGLAQLAGVDPVDGSEALDEVVRVGQEIGNPLIAVTALCHQARLQARQGRLHRARESLERALGLATDRKGRRLPIASDPLIGLGDLWREWNDLEAATRYLEEGIELAQRWSALAAFDAYGPLARVRQAQGNSAGAREAIETASRLAQESESTEVDDLISDVQRALFSVMQGDDEWAMRWAERRGLVADGVSLPSSTPDEAEDYVGHRLRKYEHLVLARLFLNQGRPGNALSLLKSLLADARCLGRVDLIIQNQILTALAHQSEGRDTQAMDALSEALALAEPGGFVRIFCDEGPPLARLLRQAVSAGISSAYAASLLAAFSASGTELSATAPQERRFQPLLEPVSDRELEVLRLLSTGMSNPEIADELYIATSTVRSHCKSIYGKLDVHKRWDAVHRAQELGLI